MTYLPPDAPIDDPLPLGVAQKAAPQSVLAAPRIPVTRWNRRYLLAGATALAAIVAGGFWLGFGGAHRPASKAPANQPAADAAPTTSSISDRYAEGYADPAVQATQAPGTASLPPPGAAPTTAVALQAPATPRQVDPAVQAAQEQATAARSAGPFFSAASSGSPPASASGPAILPVAMSTPAQPSRNAGG